VKIRVVLAEAWRSLFASVSTTIAATMTVLIGMFLLGLIIALGTWVVSWSNHVKKDLVVHVFFCTEIQCGREASVKEINAVATKLNADPRVKKIKFVSKAEALEEMKRRTPELVKGLTSNPLPPKYEVTPVRAESVEAIARSIEQPLPTGVEKVNFGKKTANRILRVAKVIWFVFLAGVLVLVSASALLIANTIRLSIFSRRREIEVMKLVGATNWFVRGPFMLEGLACGFFGALAAVILLVLGKELALPSILPRFDVSSDVHALSFPLTALIVIGVGLLLGAAGSGLTIRRFLKV
jgi:cell division transport system permease protein